MTPKKNNKYARIQTTAELDAAIREIHAARERKGRTVEYDLRGLQNRLRPATMVSSAFQHVSPYFTWSEIGLGLVRGLKKAISAPRARSKKKEVPAAPEPLEEQDNR